MANPEHLAILKQGVDVWNKWKARTKTIGFMGDLSGEDFSGSSFITADLRGVGLEYTNLHAASFVDADLSMARLHGANLSESLLVGANLRSADLQEVNLTNAVVG